MTALYAIVVVLVVSICALRYGTKTIKHRINEYEQILRDSENEKY